MGLKNNLKKSDLILFLCSGNIIRSAFADLYARHICIEKNILSAGTTYFNSRITKEAKSKLISLGVDNNIISEFSPTHISNLELSNYSKIVVFGMKRAHLSDFDLFPEKVIAKYLLSEIQGTKEEITDPYFEGGYGSVFKLIKNYVDELKLILS